MNYQKSEKMFLSLGRNCPEILGYTDVIPYPGDGGRGGSRNSLRGGGVLGQNSSKGGGG